MVKSVIIAAVLAVGLATAPASAHVPEGCTIHAESFEAAWTETQGVLREMFRFVLLPPADQPSDPQLRLIEIMEKTLELVDEVEAARAAELDSLSAWFECVDGTG